MARAPAGTRKVARKVERLRTRYGTRAVATILQVSPQTIYKVTKSERRGTPAGEYFGSSRSLARWEDRIKEAAPKLRRASQVSLVQRARLFKTSEVAGEAEVSPATVRRWEKILEKEDRPDLASRLADAIRPIEHDPIVIDRVRIFTADSERMPAEHQFRAVFKDRDEAIAYCLTPRWLGQSAHPEYFFVEHIPHVPGGPPEQFLVYADYDVLS